MAKPSKRTKLVSSQKIEEKDKILPPSVSEVRDANWENRHFVRLIAKSKKFIKVSFKYSSFEACYFRGSNFDTCNFTGCRFVATNFNGAQFNGCTFDYATFEKSEIEHDVLSTNCPGPDNLKLRFARSLRVNYQQLGDAKGANKAVQVELAANREHLFKSWRSSESYYRKKYKGLIRAQMFAGWLIFKLSDWVWGNGESIPKLLRFVVLLLALVAIAQVWYHEHEVTLDTWLNSISETPAIFFGTSNGKGIPTALHTLVVFLRLTTFGLFMSIVLKRFNTR
jgi:Pentapeptide repeats (9 copies)